MRVLLTGSSGWLGRYLAPLLAKNGHAVTGLDVVPGAHTQVIGTVADRTLVERTMGEHGIEAIIHGGALHKPDIVRYPRQAFIDVNVTGTLNLIEAAVAAGNDRFLFTSTTSLMVRADVRAGAGEAGAWWMDEDFGPIEPRNVPLVDDFNAMAMDIFNLASGNLLTPGSVLTWNVWFNAPTIVDRVFESPRQGLRRGAPAQVLEPLAGGRANAALLLLDVGHRCESAPHCGAHAW